MPRLALMGTLGLLGGTGSWAMESPKKSIDHQEFLPPSIPWSGESERLQLEPEHEWATPSERDGLRSSPDYEGTVEWLRQLCEVAPELQMVSLGKSPEQRDLWMVIASAGREFDPSALRASGKPVILAQAGIHSGEIDGKDAGMMLLRDMTVLGSKRELLEQVELLFVPIFSVDGHERGSAHSRINQRGPTIQGWRTTARNLNLNRDYAKAESLEMQHMLRALQLYDPDLYLDLHVTDGADYQYDITYGWTGPHGWSPSIGTWLDETMRPALDRELHRMGHVPGPLIFLVDEADPLQGVYDWTASPRFSTGYGDARHLPTILLENHSLKPFRQRVLGTYVFLEAALRLAGTEYASLRQAIAEDRSRQPASMHLGYERPDDEPPTLRYLGIRSELELSPISGSLVVRWTGEPIEMDVPLVGYRARTRFIERPVAYAIPAGFAHHAERLLAHGIQFRVLSEARELDVVRLRLPDLELAQQAFEGRVRMQCGEPVTEVGRVSFAPGSLIVPTDQPLGDLAILLLEPQHEDSLLQWGYFAEILSRTEYFESYVMEPMARRMLEADPELRAAFEKRLREERDFAGDARSRLQFFYERTPYHDDDWKLYPVARLMTSVD